MNTGSKPPQLFFAAESKQKNDAIGGLFDINGVIFVGTAETPRSMTLIDYLKTMQPLNTPSSYPLPDTPPKSELISTSSNVASLMSSTPPKQHVKRTTQQKKENEEKATHVITLNSAEFRIGTLV